MSPLVGAFLVFLHLKLSGAIAWDWWLVASPLVVGLFGHACVAAGKSLAKESGKVSP